MTAEEEHRIRERAYFMWEQEGRPRGRELDHRLRAEAEIAGERLRGSITALTDTAPDANIPPARDRSGANGYAGQHDRTEKRSQRQRQARGDDRERLASARQAAEALFTSKGQRTTGSVEGAPRLGEAARKPRVLPVSSVVSTHRQEAKPPKNPKDQTIPKMASSQLARIRTWLRYGMTVSQVAEIYGVDVGEIERTIRAR